MWFKKDLIEKIKAALIEKIVAALIVTFLIPSIGAVVIGWTDKSNHLTEDTILKQARREQYKKLLIENYELKKHQCK